MTRKGPDKKDPAYRLYEVQNGNHIETYQDFFPQLELIMPHAQKAFDLLVQQVEEQGRAAAQPVHSARRGHCCRSRSRPGRALRPAFRALSPSQLHGLA